MSAIEEATKRQRLGADPAGSAFVMANAGSGKTRVLTERVARLLLERVDPQQVLCITFTKAAAAEMAERLFDMLGDWALMNDAALTEKLNQLEGVAKEKRTAEDLAAVRRLFARALETPGGLKIQTIHSFCESILKRFPIEAGAPPGFSVLEDAEAAALMSDAIDDLAASAIPGAQLYADISRLSALRGERDLRALLASEAQASLAYDAVFARHNGLDGVLQALADALGADPSQSENDLKTALINKVDEPMLIAAQSALETGSKQPKERAQKIAEYFSAASVSDKWAALNAALMTAKGTPVAKLATNALHEEFPDAVAYLHSLQEDYAAICASINALAIYQDSAAHYRIVSALRERYRKQKAARAALDFDDLIAKASRLLETEAAVWVRYKLDFGIEHILVDETQDTSPEQWRVIEALTQDYLSGAGMRNDARTFFAVGDVKQSIYSFQGADAAVFEEKETTFGKALAAYHQNTGGAFRDIAMQMSFRTTAPVLQFVDELFNNEDARQGLGKDPVPRHIPAREGDAGLVELWPLAPRPEIQKTNAWDLPVDAPAPDNPVRLLCDRVADTIDKWLKNSEALASKDRPIRPSDILILVQSRRDLFNGVLSALARRLIPVAGADRLKLLDEPAIEDLLSYAKFCVQPHDDLSLAETLKSPLFGFDDDNDLFPLAHEREEGQTLWRSLQKRAAEQKHWRTAAEEIEAARRAALREGPYAFLAHVLETGDPSGRKRFHERLGEASRDGVDEMLRQALEFERGNPRSVRSFINWFQENAGTVKREMDRSQDAVRVMTAHGAKGLESNIVFLIDAHRPPSVKDIGFPMELYGDGDQALRQGRLRALVGASANDVALTAQSREEMKRRLYEEYRRLLYVAATRARDRLYITGVESGRDKNPRGKPVHERSWHALAADAFDRLDIQEADTPFWENSDETVRRFSCDQTAKVKSEDTVTPVTPVENPPWLTTLARTETTPLRISPSRLAEEEEAAANSLPAFGASYTPTDGDTYFRGRILHRLLELLPEADPASRSEAAQRLLERLAADIDKDERDRWQKEVLAVLNDTAFAAVFGPGSRAEVGVAGEINGRIVNGQIDRLIVDEKRILAVDYKTNRPPPKTVGETAPAYLAQMAAYRALLQEIYPDREINCALLWTFEARLSPLPKSLLDEAYERWVVGG